MLSAKDRLANLARYLMGRGYFTRYDYIADVPEDLGPYPEVETLLASIDFGPFLRDMASAALELRQVSGPLAPDFSSTMFPPLDGISALAAVRRFDPKRIVEIGSGDSTRYLARSSARVICIDPAPRRDVGDLGVELRRRPLSLADVELCGDLAANDILFLDSSHVMLPNNDTDIELNRIFPRLKSGVVVHVHDIFLPDNYHAEWQGRRYNEQNALIGWLFGSFDVVYAGHYVATRQTEIIRKMIDPPKLSAGSLWVIKR